MANLRANGLEAFEAYYSQAFGDRWPELVEALKVSPNMVARWNRYSSEPIGAYVEKLGGQTMNEPVLHITGNSSLSPQENGHGLLPYYRMDLASLFPPYALMRSGGDFKVLDMCAAPGGKGLVLAEALGEDGELVLNEMSQARRNRLHRVVRSYLPEDVRKRVRITGFDASRWGLYEKGVFDRVLVDAPCSSERHLLHSEVEMKTWSPARTRHLQFRQYALLVSALDVVRSGGEIVYSTCSINSNENDAVIKKLLRKRQGQMEVLPAQARMGEPTEYGQQIFPDKCSGAGPIYWSHLRKT